MGGGKNTSTTSTRLNGIAIQSSVSGSPIARGWGTFRVAANLLWYGDFTATPHTETTGGGKGGTPKNSSTTYTYSAAVILGIGAGPIVGVSKVYKDKSVFVSAAAAGLSIATGGIGQPIWGHLTTSHPDQAISYSGIAYAYAADYSLGDTGSLGNHSFEVVTPFIEDEGPDCNPSVILADFIPSVPFWPAGLLGDWTDPTSEYRDYCSSLGLLLSPVLDSQRTASEFIGEILQASNSQCFWSEGLLKIRTYADTTIGGWVPDLTSVADLTDDDFAPASEGEDPVLADMKRAADAWNYVQVEFLDRANAYNTQVAIGVDPANIDQFGRRQNTSSYQLHSICDADVAGRVAQLIVQRACNVRAQYKFTLDPRWDLLEPMDYVTITSGEDLNRVLVRLLECNEQADGWIDCVAEEVLVGVGHAGSFIPGGGGGYAPDYNVEPGPTNETALINPNRTLTNGDYELWLAAAGTSDAWGGAEVWISFDAGVSYGKAGRVDTPARIGVLTADLPSHVDPDTADTLAINLTATNGVLLPGSQADADTAVTLCLVGNELISYRDATLTGAHTYHLNYLRRGWYASVIADHPTGAPFVRLDGAICRISYDPAKAGQVVHVKFRSFNIFGNALQDLSDAADHVVTLSPGAAPVIDITATNSQALGGQPSAVILAQLAQAISDSEAAIQAGDQLAADLDAQGNALLAQALAHVDLKAYFDGIVWDGQTDLKTVVKNETTSRISGDTAIVNVLNLIGAKSADGLAFILDTAKVQVSPTESLATHLNVISASAAAAGAAAGAAAASTNTASISSEATARANADSAISTRVDTLTATVGANGAAITNEASTRAAADSATSSLISLVGAKNGAGTAFILNTSTAYVDAGTSLASYMAGVNATYGNATSYADQQWTVAGRPGYQQAQQLTTVGIDVYGGAIGAAPAAGSMKASVTTLLSVVNGPGGLTSQYTVALNANGNIAALRLAATGATSSFTIVADSLIFADSAGSLTTPFYISGGYVYADNLVVQNLRANSIVTNHINANQVTSAVVTSCGSFNFTNAEAAAMAWYFLAAVAGPVEVIVQFQIQNLDTQVRGVDIKLYKDSGAGDQLISTTRYGVLQSFTQTIAITVFDNLEAGAYVRYTANVNAEQVTTMVCAGGNARALQYKR